MVGTCVYGPRCLSMPELLWPSKLSRVGFSYKLVRRQYWNNGCCSKLLTFSLIASTFGKSLSKYLLLFFLCNHPLQHYSHNYLSVYHCGTDDFPLFVRHSILQPSTHWERPASSGSLSSHVLFIPSFSQFTDMHWPATSQYCQARMLPSPTHSQAWSCLPFPTPTLTPALMLSATAFGGFL